MKILVTGTNGQLGNEMQIVANQSSDKYIFTDVCDGYKKFDLTDLLDNKWINIIINNNECI